MEKKMIKCNGLSGDRINEIISEYVSLGWKHRNIKRIPCRLFVDSFGID